MCRQLTAVVLASLLTAALGSGVASQNKNGKTNNGGEKEDPLKKAVQQYEQRIDRLEDLIRRASEEQKSLAEAKLHKRMEAVRAELQKRLANLEREFDSVSGDNRRVKKELASARAKLDRANSQLHSTQSRFRKAESQIEDLKKRSIIDLQDQSKKSESIIKDARLRLQHANTTIATSKKELATAHTKLEQSKAQMELTQARIRRAESLIKDQKRRFTEAQNQSKKSESILKEAQLRLQRANTTIAKNKKTADGAGRAAAEGTRALKRRVNALQAALSQSNDLLAAARDEKQKAKSKRSDQSANISRVQRQLKSMTNKYNDLRRQRTSATVTAAPEVSDGTGIHIHNQGGTVVMHVNSVGAPDLGAAAKKKKDQARKKALAARAAARRPGNRARAKKAKKPTKKVQPKKRINI